jgi:hypothetical protein
MSTTTAPFRAGQTLLGPLFNEPMRVETVTAAGNASWVLGLVGAQSERFRRVTLSEADCACIRILDAEMSFERLTSVLVLPHPHRLSPEVQRLRSNPETEATAMRVVMEHERAQGRQVCHVHEYDLGYDIFSLDPGSGELRLIEVKGIGDADGGVLLTPNERRMAEDRRDCYWLCVVTHCNTTPRLREPIKAPACLPWIEVVKVAHYRMDTQGLPGGGA